MELGSISHRCAFTDCYCLNADELVIRITTGKDIRAVTLIHDDPYAGGATGHMPWEGRQESMTPEWELANNIIWTIRLKPKFKREQYYFSISDGKDTLLMFEDGFYTPENAQKNGRMKQYFKLPWMNPVDVITPPAWVNDTIWYQIMPDRFCRGDYNSKRMLLRKWTDHKHIHFWDFYGGDLRGIIEKLPYIKSLGITGIYMTPIFLSNSNHKYNTFCYDTIDPDFGTEEDLIHLVDEAHKLGIRVMLDAVFNHCGTEFAPWQDAVKNGPNSPYWDWFFINKWPLPKISTKTTDGKFYSFAFAAFMPKLNTGNPEVISYFLERCKRWVTDWHIDGIRFDVGNEVSHRFLKELNFSLKAIKPDVFLLGEIWHDSAQWLQGDEYDSTMNYPFMESLHNFWLDGQTSKELMYAMNRCYCMYPRQVSNALFNFLDTHDTMRAVTRCGNEDIFFQQLAILMTMPGSACIYYGTEIALEGGNDPDCRRPMPWGKIDTGERNAQMADTRQLIALRNQYPQLRKGRILWHHDESHPRWVIYSRQLKNHPPITVYLNCEDTPLPLPDKCDVLFSRKLEGKQILPGGIAIVKGA